MTLATATQQPSLTEQFRAFLALLKATFLPQGSPLFILWDFDRMRDAGERAPTAAEKRQLRRIAGGGR